MYVLYHDTEVQRMQSALGEMLYAEVIYPKRVHPRDVPHQRHTSDARVFSRPVIIGGHGSENL